MSDLIVFHGLPGSGKSTLACKLIESFNKLNVRSIRVNRDDIRTELFGEDYHKGTPDGKSEKAVTSIQNERILEALSNGSHVISDDTNLNQKTVNQLRKLASQEDAVLKHVFVDAPLSVAWERNKARGEAGGRLVPYFVLKSMHKASYMEGIDFINRARLAEPGEEWIELPTG